MENFIITSLFFGYGISFSNMTHDNNFSTYVDNSPPYLFLVFYYCNLIFDIKM